MSEPAGILSYAALILSHQPLLSGENRKEVLCRQVRELLSHSRCVEASMNNSTARDSAGLVIITRKRGKYYIPMLQRKKQLKEWPELWALPAGKRDSSDKDILETAIRETEEEIGVCISRDDVLGRFFCVFTDNLKYKITLFMAMPEEELFFKVDKNEADDFALVHLEDFFKDKMYVCRLVAGGGLRKLPSRWDG